MKGLPRSEYEHLLGLTSPRQREERGERMESLIFRKNFEMFPEFEWMCYPVYLALRDFIKNLDQKSRARPLAHVLLQDALHKEDASMTSGYGSTRHEFLSRENFLLRELLAESVFSFCHTDGSGQPGNYKHFAEDEIHHGLREMLTTDEIPIWLVFACQVHLDVRYILDGRAHRCYDEVMDLGRQLRNTLHDHVAFHDGPDPNATWEDDDPLELPLHRNFLKFALRTIMEIDYWVLNDPELEKRKKFWSTAATRKSKKAPEVKLKDYLNEYEPEPFHIMRRHPILSGLQKFRLELSQQEDGLIIVNCWRSIVQVTKLYNIFRFVVPEFPAWRDLDAVSAIHGSSTELLYEDNELSDTGEFFLQYVSATISSNPISSRYQTRQRGKGPNICTDKHILKPQSVVSQMFFERIRYGRDSTEKAGHTSILTLENVEALLNSLAQNSCPLLSPESLPTDSSCPISNSSPPVIPFIDPSQQITANSMFSSPSDVARAYSEFRALTPIELLSALTSCLVSESLLLNLNYVTLHRRCILLLRALASEFAPEVEKWERENPDKEGALPLKENIMLHSVTGIILRMIAVEYTGTLKGGVDPSVGQVTARRVAKIMRPVVEDEGDAEIEKVRTTLSRGSGMASND